MPDFGPVYRTLDYPRGGMKVNWRNNGSLLTAEYLGDIDDEHLVQCVKDFGDVTASSLYEALKTECRGFILDITGFSWKLKMETGPLYESGREVFRESQMPIAIIVRNDPAQEDHTRALMEDRYYVFHADDPGLVTWMAEPVLKPE